MNARLNDSTVYVNFVHVLSRVYLPGYARVRYQPYQVAFTRPRSGTAHQAVACPTCDEVVTCVVRDARGTARIRAIYGAIAAVCVLGLIAVIVYGVDWAVGQRSPLPALLLAAAAPVLLIIGIRCGLAAILYPGVDNGSPFSPLPTRHPIG